MTISLIVSQIIYTADYLIQSAQNSFYIIIIFSRYIVISIKI